MRDLQRRFSASPLTIQRTFQRLAIEGLVTTRPGDGSFVAQRSTPASALDFTWQSTVLGRAPQIPAGLDHLKERQPPGILALDGGFPDISLQPQALLSRATIRASRLPDAWDRCLPEGLDRLRAYFAAELGGNFNENDVVITPGAQSAIDSILRSFTRPGDAVLVEEPCYPGVIAAATLSGLQLIPIPTDQNGMRTDFLEAAAERSGARLVFVQPRHANPTGAVLSAERRVELINVAQRLGMFIVEDDWVRDLDLDRPSPPPLALLDPTGHVLYLRSLSKVSAPGVRLGAVIARGPAVARLRAVRLIADFFASPLLQCTVLEFMQDSAWLRHLQSLRTELRQRRDVLTELLQEQLPELQFTTPAGGVALWCRLPSFLDETMFVAGCRSRGVLVGPGRAYWLSEPPSGHVRISFAGVTQVGIAEAVPRIAAAFEDAR